LLGLIAGLLAIASGSSLSETNSVFQAGGGLEGILALLVGLLASMVVFVGLFWLAGLLVWRSIYPEMGD